MCDAVTPAKIDIGKVVGMPSLFQLFQVCTGSIPFKATHSCITIVCTGLEEMEILTFGSVEELIKLSAAEVGNPNNLNDSSTAVWYKAAAAEGPPGR